MIVVSVNNEKKNFERELSVAELLQLCGFTPEKVAVAINADFVARSDYARQQVKNNDRVDVLAPVQGG